MTLIANVLALLGLTLARCVNTRDRFEDGRRRVEIVGRPYWRIIRAQA